MTSSAVREKAVRLLAEGLVEPDLYSPHDFTVFGDTGTYWVTVTPSRRRCDCEHGLRCQRGEPSAGDCAHITAVVEWLRADAVTLAKLRVVLDARKARDAARAEELFARLEIPAVEGSWIATPTTTTIEKEADHGSQT